MAAKPKASAKNKGGRPPHKPSGQQRQEVEALAGWGVPHDDIAILVGISKPTLLKRYPKELDFGKARALARVRKNAFVAAFNGEAWAICFILKTQAGWSERQRVALEGPNGEPIPAPTFGISFGDGGPGADVPEHAEPGTDGNTPTATH